LGGYVRQDILITWLDFESRSTCDLTVAGAYNYAQDPTTEALCLAYAYDDGPVMLWVPGEPFPAMKGQLRAHNAAFDRLILTYVCQVHTDLDRWYCTAVQAAANGLPRSLTDVGRAVNSVMRKDFRGAELVRQCCIPPYNTELLPELYDYCRQDVETMRAVSKGLRDLSPEELLDYHNAERMNDKGVLILTAAGVIYGFVRTSKDIALNSSTGIEKKP
jgi:DNA polymerase